MTRNLDKIKELFYEYPSKKFTVREIAKKTGIPKSTVQNCLQELKKENKNLFRIKKIHFYIEKMFETGLIEHIEKELMASCIILFGSFRKGESEKESDIDLFIESHKKTTDLTKFEKKMKHNIHYIVEPDIKKLPQRLQENIVNGIKLAGYFRI